MDGFERDIKDRRRRFLRGLNVILGLDYYSLEDKITPLSWYVYETRLPLLDFREKLANVYGLEFTKEELSELIKGGMTAGDFTKKYCAVIYKNRGRVDLNALINSSMSNGAIDPIEMDKSHKYGLNGPHWCDVAEGPCSCGAWHE